MVSQSLQRADSTHIAWVSCVSIAFVTVAVMELLTAWRRERRGSVRAMLGRHSRLVACAVPLLVLAVVIPNFTFRSWSDYSLLTFGHHRQSWVIRRGDRIFYYGEPTEADAANQFIAVADQYIHPGDRLFVGPTNLRKTVTSEAWWYYMFPETTPSTYYIEMDPGIANAKGSRLADDLRSSDVAILSNIWNEWYEPNASNKLGDPAPERVLRKQFCKVGEYGDVPDWLRERVGKPHWFEVYEKCPLLKQRAPTPPSS
jgi:hypothetical protein